MNKDEKSKKESVLRNTWPAFIAKISFAITMSAVYLNVIIISTLLWPNEPFRSVEIGMMIGLTIFLMAFSGIFFGSLADKYSRKKLFTITVTFYGLSLVLTGLVPIGLGDFSYYAFLATLLIQSFFSGGFTPTETSYVNDFVEESKRSEFYGSINALFSLASIGGMLMSSLLFQNLLWRQFYWIMGISIILGGIVISIKAKEPKRGALQEELKEALGSEDVNYDYNLSRETFKSTVIKPTNVIAFVEGIFTTVLLAIPNFLLIAYFTGPSHNVAPFTMTILILLTGFPGTVIGSVIFAKLSDKLSKKNIRNRVYMIMASLIGMFGFFLLIFLLPVPEFSIEEGKNIGIIFMYPEIWVLGIINFIGQMILTIYTINQPPILQKINLPEAQGKISSANQFLELIGTGLGPLVAGFILANYNQNYQLTVLISVSIGMIGCLAWLLAAKSINKDVNRVSSILKERAREVKEQNAVPNKIAIDQTV